MDLFTQHLLDLLRVARDVFEVFRQVVDGTGIQGIEGHPRAFVGQRGEHQHRGWAALHDVTYSGDAIHHGHFVVHGDDIGLERQRLVDRFLAVGRGTDDLDSRVR
ncbi:hypothetical protein D3C78_1043360 [compost metagenome]